jgi:tetratricopeptide (TPR) repeat protein
MLSNTYSRRFSAHSHLVLAFTFCLGSVLSPGVTQATESLSRIDADWQNLHSNYDAGQFDEALQLLQKTNSVPGDPAYYYNFGTIHYRAGHLGTAVAYLEKAYSLAGGDPDTRHNLEIAKKALGQVIGQDRLDPGAGFADWLKEALELPEYHTLLGVLILVCLLISARTAVHGSRGVLTSPSSGLSFAIGLSGLLSLLLINHAPGLIGARPAAIALERLVIRSGPGDQYLQLTLIEPGTKLRLTGTSLQSHPVPSPAVSLTPGSVTTSDKPPAELWHQVKFSGETVGWIKSSGVLAL